MYYMPSTAGTQYSTCEARGWLRGSYEYVYTDGSIVPGYEEASCVAPTVAPGGVVCTGMWWEPESTFGVYMNILASPGVQHSTWWAGLTATLNYTRDRANADLHAVDIEKQNGATTR